MAPSTPVDDSSDLPTETLKRAWARALRHPGDPIEGHDDPRVVLLPHHIIAQIGLDEREEGRFARVSVRRATDAKLGHDEAVALVAHVFLAGRFEPFPVDCVVGADQETLHYVLDLEAYKEARALDQVARAAQLTGAAAGDAEIAAMQLACPLQALARTWDPEKIRRRDERTIWFLSDHFQVPRRWIEFQIEHYLADLEEGAIDESGAPLNKPETT
jgi:hypothetical protein